MEDGWRPPDETIFHDECPICSTKITAYPDDPLMQTYFCSKCKVDIDPIEHIYYETQEVQE